MLLASITSVGRPRSINNQANKNSGHSEHSQNAETVKTLSIRVVSWRGGEPGHARTMLRHTYSTVQWNVKALGLFFFKANRRKAYSTQAGERFFYVVFSFCICFDGVLEPVWHSCETVWPCY